MDFGLWKSMLMDPKATVADQKGKVNFGMGVNFYAIGLLVYAFLGTLYALLLAPELAKATGITYVSLIIIPITYVILGLIGSGIVVGILYLISMLLGGKGSFKQIFYLDSLYASPILIINGILQFIPFLGPLVSLLLGLYGLYLLTLVLKEANEFDWLKAVLVWLLPIIILGVLFVLLLGAAFMAMLGLANSVKPA